MKKDTLVPNRARVKGNILADWSTLLTKTSFEDFHVNREEIEDINWKGVSKKALRLNAKAEPVTMTLSSNMTSIMPEDSCTITILLQYVEMGDNDTEELEPVPYQPVYIYDKDLLIDTAMTDSTGIVEYEYSSSVSGAHTITVKSPHANGYETAKETITINVLGSTTLVLNPVYNAELGAGETKIISATLLDDQNNPVPDQPILLYEGFRALAMLETDAKGKITYEYSESYNRGEPTVLTFSHLPTHMYHGVPCRIIGNLSTVHGTPVEDMEVTLYSLWHSGARKWVNTDSNGDFTLVYTPEYDYEVPYYVAFKSAVHNIEDNEYEDYQPTWEHIGDYTAIEPFDTYFYMDLERWNYATLDGTSVPAGSQINPSVVDGNEISTGRGKLVYYVPRIPSDLTEWTLYCRLHGGNIWNRIGISTITTVGENIAINYDNTWLLADLINEPDNSTSHVIGFKFLDNHVYVYCDYIYTGFHKALSSTSNLHLVSYSNYYTNSTNYPIVFEEVRYYDAVNLSTIPSDKHTTKTLDTDLTNKWEIIQLYNTNTQPVQNDNGTRNIGANNLNYIDYSIRKGEAKTIIYNFHNTQTGFYLGLIKVTPRAYIRLADSNVNDPSSLTSGNQTIILTIDNTGLVTFYHGADSYTMSRLESEVDYYPMLVNMSIGNTITLESIKVVDKVLSSSEIANIIGGGQLMTKYNLITQEDYMTGLNPNNWTNAPVSNNDGTLTFQGKTYRYITVLPNKDCILNIEIDSTNHTGTVTARIEEGNIAMTTSANPVLIQYDNVNGTQTENNRKTLTNPFTNSTNGINLLTIQRTGNTITFRYKSPNGNLVEESRTYTNIENGFQFSIWTNSTQEVTVRSITILEKLED